MPRRMADPTFREYQWQHRYDAHVAPINSLVDSLCKPEEPERSWAPYVAPMYGGIDARLLSLLRDPGPKTRLKGGSGFLSMENDDATAERICDLVSEARISAADMVLGMCFLGT